MRCWVAGVARGEKNAAALDGLRDKLLVKKKRLLKFNLNIFSYNIQEVMKDGKTFSPGSPTFNGGQSPVPSGLP